MVKELLAIAKDWWVEQIKKISRFSKFFNLNIFIVCMYNSFDLIVVYVIYAK